MLHQIRQLRTDDRPGFDPAFVIDRQAARAFDLQHQLRLQAASSGGVDAGLHPKIAKWNIAIGCLEL